MSNKVITKDPDIINYQNVSASSKVDLSVIDLTVARPAYDLLAAEGGESFFNYIDWLGLTKGSELIVLSPVHHYYYDLDDLKKINTVVNLMPLNRISDISLFLQSISELIPQNCFFIGCFTDTRKQKQLFPKDNYGRSSENYENSIFSKIPVVNMIYGLMDLRTNRFMSKNNVTLLLESHDLKIVDMTEMDGITYFCTSKL